MTFLNPWGFLGLLGIPILIAIYLLRPHFEEKVVSSTFIWKLSLKYRKKNAPLQWLKDALVFLLQVLVIVAASLVLARPAVTAQVEGPVVLVIDASASMRAVDADGVSRFDRAVQAAEDQISQLATGQPMTVILSGAQAQVVVANCDSQRTLQKAVEALECGYDEGNLDAALELAEQLSSSQAASRTVVITDGEVVSSGAGSSVSDDAEQAEALDYIDVSSSEANAAVLGLEASRSHSRYTFKASVSSYNADASLTVALLVDGELVGAQIADCPAGETVEVTWSTTVKSFSEAQVLVENEDALDIDNEYVLYNQGAEDSQVLLVSDAPTFLGNVLKLVDGLDVTVVGTGEYADALVDEDGNSLEYDLYVFDGYLPDELPRGGSVWVFAPTSSEALEGLGVQVGEAVEGETGLAGSTDPAGTSGQVQSASTLLDGIDLGDVVVASYTPVSSDVLSTVATAGGQPVIMAGEAGTVRTVVVGFDVHDSNLPLLAAFPELVYNMVAYALPQAVDRAACAVGETVAVQAVSGAERASVSGGDQVLAISEFPATFTAEMPGTYEVTETLTGGKSLVRDVFVHIAAEESDLGAAHTVQVQAGQSDQAAAEYYDELWLPFLAALLALLAVEWGVRHRVQY